MKRKLLVFCLSAMLMICFSSSAVAAEMEAGYLHGNWAIGTKEQTCGDPRSEYFIFRENGTFEAGRSNKAEAVGFWRIAGDVVHLDFVSSGGFFQDIHAELKSLQDQFHYFNVRLVPFNVRQDRFEAVGILEDQINKGIAIRCR
ncbi:MAG: hypothetical protein JRK53_08655 [Deltaproteobacteria bacterium]|nr:hypothetical protein [Deltaproteobacteria bacterium]MBW1820015.1 hypothetical protein [Deltaproteobacteria bacterium]